MSFCGISSKDFGVVVLRPLFLVVLSRLDFDVLACVLLQWNNTKHVKISSPFVTAVSNLMFVLSLSLELCRNLYQRCFNSCCVQYQHSSSSRVAAAAADVGVCQCLQLKQERERDTWGSTLCSMRD